MAKLQLNQDLLNLIANFKPFVGHTGKALIDATQSVAQLLTSEDAANAVSVLQSLALNTSESDFPATEKAQGELEESVQILDQAPPGNPRSDSLAFSLFLIFILLIFTGSLSHHFNTEQFKEDSET